MATKIYMTSLKGGTGVTTCAVGLGLLFAEGGEKTLIVDGGRYSADGLLIGGVENRQIFTLADYARGTCRAKQTLIAHRKAFNLYFCSALGLKDESFAQKAVDEIGETFDYIIFDKICKARCDSAIIVTEPYAPSIKSADICKAELQDEKIKNIGLIINKLNGGQVIDGKVMGAKEIAALLRLPIKAVIPEDLSLPLGRWKKTTMNAFKLSVQLLRGKKEAYCNVTAPYIGLNGYIKRKVREKL